MRYKLIKHETGYDIFDSHKKLITDYISDSVAEACEYKIGVSMENPLVLPDAVILYEFDSIEEFKENHIEEFI